MELNAQFSASDLAHALVELAPIRLHFTPEDEDTRWIEIEKPKSAMIVRNEGLRIVCDGRLRYSVSGMRLEAAVHRMQLLVSPQVIEPQGERRRLNFRIRIEDLDIQYVPGMFDKFVVSAVDKAVTPRTTELYWQFGRTLSGTFPMPSRLEPIDALRLEVIKGDFVVNQDNMQFRIKFAPLIVERSSERPLDDQLPE